LALTIIPLKDKIATLKEEMERLKKLEIQVLNVPISNINNLPPVCPVSKSRNLTARQTLRQTNPA
jgi:hypothetical protein